MTLTLICALFYCSQVKKEDPNIRRTVLNSVVGTLDLSIRLLLHGEKFPGVREPPLSSPHLPRPSLLRSDPRVS